MGDAMREAAAWCWQARQEVPSETAALGLSCN